MSAFLNLVEPFARAVAIVVLNALWEDAFIVLTVALMLRAWPRLNAATRYAVWFLTLVGCFVVPILTTLPFLAVAQPPNPMHASAIISTRTIGSAARSKPGSPVSWEAKTPTRQSTAASPFERPRIALPEIPALAVGAVWLLAMLALLVRLGVGLLRLERLKYNALPLPMEHRDSLARWSNAHRGGRIARLCVSDETEVPVAVGLFDSMVLIPRHLLESLSESELDQISLHELSHLRRADDWTNFLQRVLAALLCFSPAVYFVGRQLDLEREVACDDDVLAATGEVRPYARCLTKMAEATAWPHRALVAPGAFVTRRGVSERIERLLRAGRNAATGLAIAPTIAALAIVGGLAFLMQAVAPTAAAPSLPAQRALTAAVATPASVATTRHVSVPATRVAIPATHVAIPATRVTIPETRVEVPSIDVSVPATEVHVPGVNVTVPAIHVHVPSTVAARGSCNACDFTNVNWSGRDLHGNSYVGADFSNARLIRTNFSHAKLTDVDFSDAILRGAIFRGARLVDCDLSNADARGADFTGAGIDDCAFSGALLDPGAVRLILESCNGCEFAHSNLVGANLAGFHITGDDLSHSDLHNANLRGARLTDVDLSYANLDGANFTGAVLTECDLSGVDLSHVDLSKARIIDSP
jgi:uncharacterized protein YjbI with pentapeptide repeats/beta-lactamase regulating signal transducer with metallopeptidase domain